MKEEFVTLSVMSWLSSEGWSILSYDFPQSGTGFILRKNGTRHKTKATFIPDIVAVKNNTALIFENKDHFSCDDVSKLELLKNSDEYSNSLNTLLGDYKSYKIYFGIAIPKISIECKKSIVQKDNVDFILTVDTNGIVRSLFKKSDIAAF